MQPGTRISRGRRPSIGKALRSAFLLLALCGLVIHSPAGLALDDGLSAFATAAQAQAMAAPPDAADADDLAMLVGCHHGPGHDHTLCSPLIVLAAPLTWASPAPRHDMPQNDIPRLFGRADAPRAPPPRLLV